MRAGAKLLFIVSLAVVFAGCSSNTASSSAPEVAGGGPPKGGNSSAEKPLVYFSQANSADPWRQVFDAETKAEAEKHTNEFSFEETTANDDPNTQITQVETELVKKPKVMLISPATIALQKAVEEAHDAGIKVVLLDRSVPGDKWDVYIGGDNHAIGALAGDFMGKKMNGKGTILMIQGIADAPPTKDRANGFMESMQKYPGIKVIPGENCDYNRQKAETYMENFLQSGKQFDAVYAHNDEMAIGAYLAMKNAHTPKKVLVGIDGCQMEVVKMIKDGNMDASFSYPDPGPKGVDVAAGLANGTMPKAKKITLQSEMITKETADQYSKAHPNLAK